jgi:ABC-type microcin C transport system permease subunit YejB
VNENFKKNQQNDASDCPVCRIMIFYWWIFGGLAGRVFAVMKLLTLNYHAWQETNQLEKIKNNVYHLGLPLVTIYESSTNIV